MVKFAGEFSATKPFPQFNIFQSFVQTKTLFMLWIYGKATLFLVITIARL